MPTVPASPQPTRPPSMISDSRRHIEPEPEQNRNCNDRGDPGLSTSWHRPAQWRIADSRELGVGMESPMPQPQRPERLRDMARSAPSALAEIRENEAPPEVAA